MSNTDMPTLSIATIIEKWKWRFDPVPDWLKLNEKVQQQIILEKIKYTTNVIKLDTQYMNDVANLQNKYINDMSAATQEFNNKVSSMISGR